MGWKCACCPLSMNTNFFTLSVDFVIFNFGNIMTDIVNQAESEIGFGNIQCFLKTFLSLAVNNLSIGPGEIGGCGHCAQILFAFLRANRRANQLAIRQRNPIFLDCFSQDSQIVFADLMSQAARAAMDHYHDLSGE